MGTQGFVVMCTPGFEIPGIFCVKGKAFSVHAKNEKWKWKFCSTNQLEQKKKWSASGWVVCLAGVGGRVFDNPRGVRRTVDCVHCSKWFER